ncbi:TPA: hypothetical protein ACN7AP_001314 [Klebsiella pneumoniae]
MTNNQLTDDRLVKILSETQATIMEHNSRCVRGSVEVDARLFESMIMELQERRKAEKDSEPVAWIVGSDEIDEFNRGREVMVMRDSDDEELESLPLYRHAQPAPASEPVFFIEVEGDDWINAGRIEGKNRQDLGLLPDGINYLYAAPQPAPVVPDAEAVYARLSDHEKWSTSFENVNYVLNACRAAMLASAP